MEAYINFDNQIAMMDSIIKSIADIMIMFRGKENLDEKILFTMKQIFGFLEKVLDVFPRVLLSDDHYTIIKDELVRSFAKVHKAWTSRPEVTDDFENAWNEVTFWWNEYRTQLKKIQESKQAIYLSMN
jgi:hypothetical protein